MRYGKAGINLERKISLLLIWSLDRRKAPVITRNITEKIGASLAQLAFAPKLKEREPFLDVNDQLLNGLHWQERRLVDGRIPATPASRRLPSLLRLCGYSLTWVEASRVLTTYRNLRLIA
ncbi:MAG: hypothetical protein ACP5US_07840 [Candidatus Kryptoniota bacterium]